MSEDAIFTLEELRKLGLTREKSFFSNREENIQNETGVKAIINDEELNQKRIMREGIDMIEEPPRADEIEKVPSAADDSNVSFRLKIEQELERYPIHLQVKHISAFLGIGRTLVYALIKNGDIPKLNLSHSRLVVVPKSKFIDWYIKSAGQ